MPLPGDAEMLARPAAVATRQIMRLPGTLGRTTVGDVFGTLHRGRATGVLELVEQSGPRIGWLHRVHFHQGLVEHVQSALPVRRLGDILREAGALGSVADRVVRPLVLRRSAQPLGLTMIDAGLVDREAVQHALRLQLRERVDRLCALRDARLSFRVAERLPARAVEPLGPRDFLHGRKRFRATRQRASVPSGAPSHKRSAQSAAFAVLGLPEGADRKQVQAAFRRLAALHHPDRLMNRPGVDMAASMRRFAELSAAYHALIA